MQEKYQENVLNVEENVIFFCHSEKIPINNLYCAFFKDGSILKYNRDPSCEVDSILGSKNECLH